MALVNPQIAMSYRPTVEYQPRNALAEAAQLQNIVGAQTQQEVATMQLEKMRRDEANLASLMRTITEKGGPADPIEASMAMIKSQIPHFMDLGFKMQEAIRQGDRDRITMGLPPLYPTFSTPKAGPAGGTTEPAAPAAAAPVAPQGDLVAAPIAPPVGTVRELPPGSAPGPERALAAPTNVLATAAAPAAPAPVNALAPTPAPAAAPANAMVRAPEIQRALGMMLSTNPGVRKAGELDYSRLTATPPETIRLMNAFGIPISPEGFVRFERLKQNPGEFTRLLEASGLPEADQRALIRQRLQKESTHAPATTVNVSTEKKFGERFGGLVAERDVGKLEAAENAGKVIENADRITELLATGKVITGTGANVRLQLAKALNLAGGTDTERIANTEVLISSLARSTMGAIKQSNLGAGQGFTNADRDFLEKAESGQITYDAASLRRLADLSRRAGVASIESWNKRVQQIPKAALEGTGISSEPIPVPGRRPASVMNIPQAAIDMLKSGKGTREQFDEQFGPGSADRVLPRGK